MTLGQKVKKCRRELGMTQVELRAKTGLSQGYISMLALHEYFIFSPLFNFLARFTLVPCRLLPCGSRWSVTAVCSCCGIPLLSYNGSETFDFSPLF